MQFAVHEPVADAPDVDHQLLGAVAAQLAPQAGSVAVERAGVPERLRAPDRAHQLRAREHPGRLAGERDQQVVLLRRQLDRAVEHTDLAGADVDHDRTGAQDPRARAAAPSAAARRRSGRATPGRRTACAPRRRRRARAPGSGAGGRRRRSARSAACPDRHAPASPSPERIASTNSSVPPLTSTRIRSGCAVVSSAIAFARSGAISTR